MRITAPTTRAPVSARFSDGLQIHFKPPTPQSQKEIGSSGYLAGALSARFESHEGRGKNLGGILDTNRGRLDRNQIGCGDYCAHCDRRYSSFACRKDYHVDIADPSRSRGETVSVSRGSGLQKIQRSTP